MNDTVDDGLDSGSTTTTPIPNLNTPSSQHSEYPFEQQIYLNINGLNPTTVICILCAIALYFTVVLLFHVVALLYSSYLFSNNNRKLCKFGFDIGSDGNNNIINSYSSVASQNDIIFPFVTILKPLRGADEHLEENLETFFKLNYPNVSICIKRRGQK